jgi:HSP20 family molecular chaperone IbpA
VEKVGAAESQARALAQKKRELEDQKNAMEVDKARAARERAREAAKTKEAIDKELVEISRAGERQAELLKKLNSERVRSLNENSQKTYESLADATAGQIRLLDDQAAKAIESHRLSNMEKVRFMTDQAEDPFYRLKSLNPTLSEAEREFNIRLNLPEHEAHNLFVASEGRSVKLSLARRFQDQAQSDQRAGTTKTSSFQTIVETLELPAPVDAKGISREFADGVVTIRMPKAGV